ncbi:MAG TPA: hypothetical protein VK589_05580, partial [Chryseolinea sp.]|nr:hypothetical protein [Chryseolinea sp.]
PSSSASSAVAFGEGGHSINQTESKPRIRNGFEALFFWPIQKSHFFPFVRWGSAAGQEPRSLLPNFETNQLISNWFNHWTS